jgi:hypothetical protein
MKANSNKSSGNNNVAVGVGLGVAAIAAAAGAYFLYGTKDGSKKRAQVKGWVLKMKGEVLDQMENMKEMNEGLYTSIVDKVAKSYGSVQSIDPQELKATVDTLKKYWKEIQKSMTAKKGKSTKAKAKPKASKPKVV